MDAVTSVRTGSLGGFAVPEQFVVRTFQEDLDDTVLLRFCDRIEMTSDKMRVPALADDDHSSTAPYGITWSQIPESGDFSAQEVEFRALQLKITKSGPATYWVATWFDEDGYKRSKSLGRTDKVNERKARKAFRVHAVEVERNRGARTPTKLSLAAFADHVIRVRGPDPAPKTLKAYKKSLEYAKAYFGETVAVRKITPRRAAEFKAALARGILSPMVELSRKVNNVSTNHHIRNLRALFNIGVNKTKVLTENPFSGLVRNLKKSKQKTYITREQFQRLMEVATNNFKALIAMWRLAGLRRLEGFYMKWSSVDFAQNLITVVGGQSWQPKGRKTRAIPMAPELQEILLTTFDAAQEGAVYVAPPDQRQQPEPGSRGHHKAGRDTPLPEPDPQPTFFLVLGCGSETPDKRFDGVGRP